MADPPPPLPPAPALLFPSAPSPLTISTSMTSTTSTTSKRKSDAISTGDDHEAAIIPPIQPAATAPLLTTMPFHTAPRRADPSSASSVPRFSFIAPMPSLDLDGGVEIDSTPPYPPFLQTAPAPISAAVAAAAALSPSSDDASSPRTRVAHRFRSLAIAPRRDDGPLPEAGSNDAGQNGDGPLHKRMKRDGGGGDDRSPSPPRVVVDPLRASLTWQDDEITVYDPNDPNDDGRGVNGIGFKPTPAIARERALKRRQQLAEYRRREEREARAWRSLQRARAHQQAAAMARAAATPGASGPADTTTATATAADASSVHTAAQTLSLRAVSRASPSLSPPASSPVRRVRFLESGPVTIRFLEPDPVPCPSPTSILASS